MTEKCQKCGEEGEDRRTLWMACFYEMMELGIPFEKEIMFTNDYPRCDGKEFYTIRVCKGCRADWMTMIKIWWDAPLKKTTPCNSGIYIRHYGATVEISEEEFKKRYPGREPIRVKDVDI